MRSARCVWLGFCVALLSCALAAPLWAAPVLPGLCSDHMVLQQGRELPVWGWADRGEKISVSIANVARSTTAGGLCGRAVKRGRRSGCCALRLGGQSGVQLAES